MNHLLNTFIEISLSSTGIIILTALLSKFTRKYYSNRWCYYVWLLLAVRMLLPYNLPLIQLPDLFSLSRQTSVQEEAIALPESNTIAKATGITLKDPGVVNSPHFSSDKGNPIVDNPLSSTLPNESKPTIQSKKESGAILFWLPYIWLMGIIIHLLWHFITYTIFLRKIKRWSMSIREDKTIKLLKDITAELNIRKPIKLVTCKYVYSPMMISCLHPRIILPFNSYTEAELTTIIKHELIHYKHYDICYKFILLCMNAIHWFNPFAYFLVKCANQSIELYCDESVISKQDEEYRKNYSYALLRTVVKQQKQHTALSTYFNGGNRLMKERFTNIMSNSPKKKGILFFTLIFCLIVLTSFVAADSKEPMKSEPASNNMLKASSGNDLTAKENEDTQSDIEKPDNILLIGIHGQGGKEELIQADSIMLITIQPKSKNITLTSFLRDMYVEIPNHSKDKLNAAYAKGGIELLEETLEYNFGISIDSTVELNYSGFENIIDLLGGVEVNLTEKEASYLNSTNFISKPENRNIAMGEQVLNGNQALGYARIRHVANANGVNGDMGRTERQRNLLLSIYEKSKSIDSTTLLAVANAAFSNVTTNLKKDRIVFYLNTLLEPGYTTHTMQIPVEGSYEADVIDGKSVLDIDLTENKNELVKLLEP